MLGAEKFRCLYFFNITLLPVRSLDVLTHSSCISSFWPQHGALQIEMWPLSWQFCSSLRRCESILKDHVRPSLQPLPCIQISWGNPPVTNQSHMPFSERTVQRTGRGALFEIWNMARSRLIPFPFLVFFILHDPLSWRFPLGGWSSQSTRRLTSA